MTDFQRDMEILINEGVLNANKNKIRFVMRYPNRLTGDIEKLELSTRAHNCCKRSGIDKIEDIDAKWDELYKIKQAGKKTAKEIKNLYIAYYYGTLDDKERKDFWRDTVEATENMY